MKLTIDRDDLSAAVSTVSRAVAGKTALPILSHVLLKAVGDSLVLTGTDLTTGLRTAVNARVADGGSIAMDARYLAEWLGSAPAGEIQIEADTAQWRATFRSANGRITLAGLDPEDFPKFPVFPEDTATLPAATFRAMIGRTVIATAPDESRPVLHGLRILVEPQRVELAAADGFRMAVDRLTVDTGISEPISAIVPRESVQVLATMIDDEIESIVLALAGPQQSILVARVGASVWSSRLIEGTFPNVEQLIRREHTATIEVARQSLRSAVRGVRSLVKVRDNVGHVRLTADVEEVAIDAESSERGEADARIPAMVNGTAPVVMINRAYLDETLGALDGNAVRLHLGDGATRPINVTSPTAPDHVTVIMPVVIKDA